MLKDTKSGGSFFDFYYVCKRVVQQAQTVWRHAGCMLAESFAGTQKFVARASFCVPPPERQAANRLAVMRATFEQK